jgi:hypothetical protein
LWATLRNVLVIVPNIAATLAAPAELPTGAAGAGTLTAISIHKLIRSRFICSPSGSKR